MNMRFHSGMRNTRYEALRNIMINPMKSWMGEPFMSRAFILESCSFAIIMKPMPAKSMPLVIISACCCSIPTAKIATPQPIAYIIGKLQLLGLRWFLTESAATMPMRRSINWGYKELETTVGGSFSALAGDIRLLALIPMLLAI